MKYLTTTFLISFMFPCLTSASAIEGCQAKRTALDNELKIAQEYNNTGKVNGLKRAIAEVNTYCTPERVKQDVEKRIVKLERKISERKEDIREIEYDLENAKIKGNTEKVSKYQHNLDKKKGELDALSDELFNTQTEFNTIN